MILKWPTDKERIREYMRIPPTKKMEWLYAMSKFIYKVRAVKNCTKSQSLSMPVKSV